jgi:hypothetical protein
MLRMRGRGLVNNKLYYGCQSIKLKRTVGLTLFEDRALNSGYRSEEIKKIMKPSNKYT